MEKFKIVVDRRLAQQITGEVEDKAVYATLTNNLIKHINEISNNKVYWTKWEGIVKPISENGFGYAEEVLEDLIYNYVVEQVKRQKDFNINIVIDVNTLDLTKFLEALKECEEKLAKQQVEQKRIEEIQKRIEEICEKNNFLKIRGFYSDCAVIEEWIRDERGNGIAYLKEIRIRYNEDDIKELESLTKEKLLLEYIQELKEENEELKEKAEKKKEEILKEMWKNEETATIKDEREITLRVVSDENDDC